jgi:hypothetical protein
MRKKNVAVRVRIRVKSSEKETETSPLVNTGFETDEPKYCFQLD